MRRITKIGSVALALLITVPAILSLDLFGGAAAEGGPLLYTVDKTDPVTHLAYAERPLTDGVHTYGYAEEYGEDAGGITIRERSGDGTHVYTWFGGRVNALATDRDGSEYVAGTSDGQLVYVTSTNVLYDTERIFEAGSPVTDVAIDASGNWFTAVTYHGDVYLFQRERFLDSGGFVWRQAAPMPVGALPVSPELTDLVDETADGLSLDTITARPYSHVVLAGSANADRPDGLFVVAGTAFGEIWVFDAAQGTGPAGANGLRPETYHVGDGKCAPLLTDPYIEAPCTREASERFVERLDTLTGSIAHDVLMQVADTLGGMTLLDPATALVPLQTEVGLLDVAATTGPPSANGHLVVAAQADGALHAVRIRSANGVPAEDGRSVLQPLWKQEAMPPLMDIDLAPFDHSGVVSQARLAVADQQGKLTSHLLDTDGDTLPAADITQTIPAGAITHVALSRGGTPADPSGGRYLAFGTEALEVHLLDTRRSVETGAPQLRWKDNLPLLGDIRALHVAATGSTLVAANGLALYGGTPSVFIEAAESAKKNTNWTASAEVSAPDSPIADLKWTLRPESGGSAVTYSTSEIRHVFTTEGRYNVSLEVTDAAGYAARATMTVSVGGEGPRLVFDGPERASVNEVVLWRFNGTEDPDANSGIGIDKILIYPFGGGQAENVSLDSMSHETIYPQIGEYRVRAVAFDKDGRSTEAFRRITVNDGGWCIPEDQSSGTSDGCGEPEPPIEDDDGTDGGDGNGTDGGGGDGNETGGGDGNETGGGDGNETDGGGNGTTDPNTAPTAAMDHHVTGFTVRVDGARSSDPDGDTLTHEWSFGEGTRAHGTKATHVYSVAGTYTIRLTVDDGKGGRTTTQQDVAIAACSPAQPFTGTEQIRYGRLSVAHTSGHTITFGANGQDSGRFDIRTPNTKLVYREPRGSSPVTQAVLTADGCHAYVGDTDGSILYMNVGDPDDRRRLQVFAEDTAIDFLRTSDSGDRVLVATTNGRITLLDEHLQGFVQNITVQGTIERIVTDRTLYNIIVQTNNGVLHSFSGEGLTSEIRDTHTSSVDITSLALTPNLDGGGRAWAFIGRADGVLEIVKVQGHRLYPLGTTEVQAGVPVHKAIAGPINIHGHYRVALLTADADGDCRAQTEEPCGRISLIDSRGPYDGVMPIPRQSRELTTAGFDLAMGPEGRQFLLTQVDRSQVHRYDTVWRDGPLQTLSGFRSTIRTMAMADNGNAYGLLDDGRLVWFYAPPLADFRIGPHDENGDPQWGERVTAKRPITFDPSPTRSGAGRVVSYQWDFGDGATSTDPLPQHTYAVQGRYAIQLTVTSRVDSGRETLLVDRYRSVINVYDPPPVARLGASPFDSAIGAVNITSGESVHFDASQSADAYGGRIVHYHYDFGDGQSWSGIHKSRAHLYGKGGVFYARLTVVDDQGFKDVSDPIRIIVANRAPTAAFGWGQAERNETNGWVTYGVPVTFDAGASDDPDGQVRTYEWTFPDGTTKNGRTVQHTFPTTGTSEVVLRVRDDSGTWSLPRSATLTVDDGIRLRHTQDPASGRSIDPTQTVRAHGFVHDFSAYPGAGNGIPNVQVIARVYYDGPLGGSPTTDPYETRTYLTDPAGNMVHEVSYNQGIAFKPGKYRVQLTAVLPGSLNGDTEYSQTTETHFVVT